MENEIMDATMLESDDEPIRRRPEGRRRRRDQEEIEPSDKQLEEEIEPELEKPLESEFSGTELEKNEIIHEEEVSGKPSQAKIITDSPSGQPAGSGHVSPDLMKIGGLIIVLILLISVVSVFMLKSDESDVVVNVPDLMIGDIATYSVSGKIEIENAHDDPIAGEIKKGSLDLKGSTVRVETEGISQVTDGYYNNYSALKTSTETRWQLSGWADTVSYQMVDINGYVELSSDAYRNGDIVLLTEISSNGEVTAKAKNIGGLSETYKSNDYLRTYSSTSGDLQADLEDVIHTPDLKKGMSGNLKSGDTSYSWRAVGNAEVFKTDCVVVEFKAIDPPEDIDSQTLKMYLSSKHPFPVRTNLKLTTSVQGTVTVEYTMTMNSYVPGDTILDLPIDLIDHSSPFIETDTMEIYPSAGTTENSTIPDDFDIQDAHEKAIDGSGGLVDYLDSHSDAYIVQAIYSDKDSLPLWNLTYSYPGATEGYHVLVTESEVQDNGTEKLGDIGSALEVNADAPDDAISWASAEQIMKNDAEIRKEAFSGDAMDLEECKFAVRTRLYQPSIDLVSMFASAPRVDYGYALSKGDTFAAGVDAQTGQLLFVATHSGVSLF